MRIIPRPSPCTLISIYALILHTCTHTHSSLKVTTLSAYKSSKRISGKPHKVSKLVQIVDKATKNFVVVGEEIASENPEFQVWFAFAFTQVFVHIYSASDEKLSGGVGDNRRVHNKANCETEKYAHAHSHIDACAPRV